MSEATRRALTSNRKKRGVTCSTITKLGTQLSLLEGASHGPETADKAKRLATRLEALFEEFKVHHFSVLDLLEEEEDLAEEQEVFDCEDEKVTQIAARLERLTSASTSSGPGQFKKEFNHLKRLEKGLSSILDRIPPSSASPDVHLLQQLNEQLSEYKKDFSDVRLSLFVHDIDDTSDLGLLLERVEEFTFDCGLELRKQLRSHPPASTSSSVDTKGIKLPKLDVPTFDGNILNWKTFWEQFNVAVHDRSSLTDSEKLAYLRHALKAGSAKSVIEGLSRSGDQYDEAITCLKARFDRPRLIHQAHVRKIPNLKDGNGRELRHLHDTALQHLRALRAMGHEPSETFVTSMLELKLDANTMFEWQRHSQSSTDVPPFKDFLDFINLRAQASESAVSDAARKSAKAGALPTKKSFTPSKAVASFAASADTSSGNCLVCKSEKHPLFACSQFKSLNHADKFSLLKTNGICLNCLRPGHYIKGCKSLHMLDLSETPSHSPPR